MVVESYSENNMSASMIGRHLDRYWLGLASLDDLRTNTLESAAGMLVSQYAGSYAMNSASHSASMPYSASHSRPASALPLLHFHLRARFAHAVRH